MKIATVATTLEITVHVNAASSQAKGTKSTSFEQNGILNKVQAPR